MRKNLWTKTVALVLVSAMLAACGGNAGSGSGTTTAGGGTTAAGEKNAGSSLAETEAKEVAPQIADGLEIVDGRVVETDSQAGLKLVDEPTTLVIGYQANPALGSFEDSYYFTELSEKTGITFQFEEYADQGAVTAMFASRQFPDILLYGATDDLLFDAAEAGDIVCLDEYLPEYAPYTWQFYDDYPDVKASITANDGHIYSLPAVNRSLQAIYPDFWFINTKWIEDLGLEIPKTTQEFHDVMKAFKDHAGEGDIPSNVIPLYMNFFDNQLGMSDVINCFGTYVSFGSYWAMVDEDGKVLYNWVNPDIKEPLEYIHNLIADGLCSLDGFTDTGEMGPSKTGLAQEDLVGSYFTIYSYGDFDRHHYESLRPLDSGNGKTPKYKLNAPAITRNRFTVFKKCENVELAMRLAEVMGREWFSCTAMSGRYGEGWEYIEGGILDTPKASALDYKHIGTSVPQRVPMDLHEKFWVSGKETLAITTQCRLWNGEANDAADAYLPQSMIYPDFIKEPEVSARLSELQTDIESCIKQTYSNWLINGGIEEGWDAFVKEMDSIGLQEYLDLLQQSYDNYYAILNE